MSAFRTNGGLVDRSRQVSFNFDGKSLKGFDGDTLASALLANDEVLVGRSFKYHRPRGVVRAGSSEPNALVTIGSGGRTEPNVRATMAELYRRHGSPRPPGRVPGVERACIGRVVDYLRAHYAETIVLDDLAALAGMSAFHFLRSFKKEVGLPPHAFLTQLRLQQARRLLAQGLGQAETAAAVGFYDQPALSRHFKKIYGVTPGQYARAVA